MTTLARASFLLLALLPSAATMLASESACTPDEQRELQAAIFSVVQTGYATYYYLEVKGVPFLLTKGFDGEIFYQEATHDQVNRKCATLGWMREASAQAQPLAALLKSFNLQQQAVLQSTPPLVLLYQTTYAGDGRPDFTDLTDRLHEAHKQVITKRNKLLT